MLHFIFIALQGVRAHENVEHSKHRENVIDRDWSRVVELLLQLENKQQSTQNNMGTQHNHMYSLYIDSLCNVAFPMACFTCIVTSQMFVEIWMRWSIALRSAFDRGRKHLWIVFNFRGRDSGINSSQSKNVEKIQFSMQLSHLNIIFENLWF